MYVFAWLVVVFGLLLLLLSLLITASRSTLPDDLALVAVICVAVWFVWLVGIAQRIVVSHDGLVVVSWFARWDVPWSAMADVTAPGNLVIELTDGRRIKPGIGGDSVLNSLLRNARQRRMRDAILARRPAVAPSSDTSHVRRRLDLHPWLLVALLLVFEATAVLIDQIGH